jgi:hypothetical protein
MKWSRGRDYHGYKSYGNDGHAADGGMLAGLIGGLKSILAVIAKPTPSPVNLNKGARGYSTLGTRSGPKGPVESPFPTAPANSNPARRP